MGSTYGGKRSRHAERAAAAIACTTPPRKDIRHPEDANCSFKRCFVFVRVAGIRHDIQEASSTSRELGCKDPTRSRCCRRALARRCRWSRTTADESTTTRVTLSSAWTMRCSNCRRQSWPSARSRRTPRRRWNRSEERRVGKEC